MKIQKNSKIITIKAEILSIHKDERKVFIDYEGRKMILLLNKNFESTFNFIKDFFTSSDSVLKIDRLAVSLINVRISFSSNSILNFLYER